MRDTDLGYDKITFAHNMALTALEGGCIDIMRTRGEGQAAAISAADLTEALELGSEEGDDGKRGLRKLINHLIMTHKLPIICQAGFGGGYYLTGAPTDTEQFYRTFVARGKTGLFKASCGRRAAYVDITYQYTLGFDDEPNGDMNRKSVAGGSGSCPRKPQFSLDDGPPVWVQVVSKCLDRAAADPDRYAAEIAALQKKYGDIFVPREKVRQLREKTAEFQQLLKEIAG
jgi:hypothetical protein